MSATLIVETWLAATLGADTQLQAVVGNPARVYAQRAPEQNLGPDQYPFITYSQVFATDVNVIATGASRIMSVLHYDVHIFGHGRSIVALDAAMDRVDVLLRWAPERPAVPIAGGLLLSARRMGPPRSFADPDAGSEYRHLVTTYLVNAQDV